MQVEPMKPVLKAPGIERLKLKHDRPLSNFAFNFNLRRYTAAWRTEWAAVRHYLSAGRRPNTHRPRFTINLTVVCLQCTGGPVHTRRILLPGTACRLLTVYRWTRAHSPHPPPWHCLSGAHAYTALDGRLFQQTDHEVRRFTLTVSKPVLKALETLMS